MTTSTHRRIYPRNDYTPLDASVLQQSVKHRFEGVADQYAQRLAFKTRTAAITYGELNAHANRLAHALLALSRTPSEPVILLLSHSTWIPVGLIGTAKAGKFYVPLDLTHPPARVQAMIAEMDAAIVVTDRASEAHVRSLVQGSSIRHVLLVDALDPALPDTNPDLDVSPDAPLYLTFTSGTSGTPKGMVRTHFAVVAGTYNDVDDFHLTPEDRWALVSSYSFGGSRKVFFDALLMGSAICAFDVKREGYGDLAQWLADDQVSIFYSTTSLFRHVASTLDDSLTFPNLRLLIVGSETVHAHDVRLYQQRFSNDCLLVNAAGSTETSAFAHYFIDKETVLESAVVPIGYPVRDTEILLLDEQRNPLSDGEIGEIAVKGRYIFPGYWKDGDRNDSKFLLMPDGEWMYLSGDLGRKRPDGALEHLGRRDFQIKIRGHRIEPAEIEAALLLLPSMRGAAVFAFDTPTDPPEKRLIAHLVCDTLPPPSVLRRHLLQHLPDYMLPFAYVRLDAIPLTLLGKVDLQALPAPDWSALGVDTLFVEASTDSERYLVDLWRHLLKLERISAEDNFFELGGSSLNAGEMVSRIKRELGVNISLPMLVKQTTLKQLAALIDQNGSGSPASSLAAIRRSKGDTPLFLVPPSRGQVMGFYTLGRRIETDLPIYAFQQRGLDGSAPLYTSVSAMVQDYVALMRAVQPSGAYYLGGRSFGGMIAYEVARQLHAQGERVGCVFLFDSTFPGVDHEYPEMTLDSLWEFPIRLFKVFRNPRREWLSSLHKVLFLLKKYILEIIEQDPEPKVVRANQRLYRTFRVEPYTGRVAYVRAVSAKADDRVERWRALCSGRFDVYEIAGDHDAMFDEPGVAELARLIERCMND